MSFCLLKRIWDKFFIVGPSNKELFGVAAENLLKKLLNNYTAFYNKILQSPRNNRHFIEIDSIVLKDNKIFCIEIKNYKGKIYYSATYNNDEFHSYNHSKIIQLKQDVHLNQIYKELPNPVDKTKYFMKYFREYLLKKDKRFLQFSFVPVVVFMDNNSNISNIHSFDDGIIYLSELKEFIEKNSKSNNFENSWAIEILKNLPTWDRIIGTNNYSYYGILKGELFKCYKPKFTVEYSKITSAKIQKKLFNCTIQLNFKNSDNATSVSLCQDATIYLDKFGHLQKHKLNNIKEIIVGTTTLRANHLIY